MLWLASKSHTFFAPLQAFHAKYIHSSSSTRLLSVQLIRQAAIHNTIDAKCSILSKNNIPLMRVQFRTIKFAELCVNMNLLSFFDSIIQQKPKKKQLFYSISQNELMKITTQDPSFHGRNKESNKENTWHGRCNISSIIHIYI